MSPDRRDLLVAFLHDPPDKALRIRGHVDRAVQYASIAAQTAVSPEEIGGLADQLASIAERLPMPTAGKNGERSVEPQDGSLSVVHPLSAEKTPLQVGEVAREVVAGEIEQIVHGLEDPFDRFLAIWRLLPERLAQRDVSFARLPADTRVPDHTIWHHLDTTAGLAPALSGQGGPAFLSFSLGPVQPFIAAARSVRDLWSGSAILSWLTFQAMLPVIRQLGPTALVFPSLRGTPMLDMWLRGKRSLAEKVEKPSDQTKKAPCIPNRFLAIVPWGPHGDDAESIARECRQSTEEAWRKLTDEVRKKLDKELQHIHSDWARLWDPQVSSFFEIRTAVLPLNQEHCDEQLMAELAGRRTFGEAFPNAAAVRGLADALPKEDRPSYDQKHAGRWQAQVELSARLMEAQRSVRHVPDYHPTGDVPPKCGLMGTYEQMGPPGLDDSRKFWEQAARQTKLEGVRLRSGERLCAVALAKRFALPAFLENELGLHKVRFPDTATVAAAKWLKEAGINHDEVRKRHDWSGQWLHWPRGDFDPDEECPEEVWDQIREAKAKMEADKKGPPPAYYAVLTMDGDDMGKWLSGKKTPRIGDILHQTIVDYLKTLPDCETVQRALNAPRPVGPALHAAISEALSNFAIHVVPGIVEASHGTLIYAGGDDVLALLPARSALKCAGELRLAFSGDPLYNGNAKCPGFFRKDGRDLLMMGAKASLSAGLAVVHYKEDLREAIEAARTAERAAKNSGKDALQLAILRRSGEHSSALCSWDRVTQIEEWVYAFEQGASDRWAYHLRQEIPTLSALPLEAIQAEIRRQVDRSEQGTRERLCPDNPKAAGSAIAEAFATYHALRLEREKAAGEGELRLDGRFLEDFICLCQSASFLARGRDR